jgi:hypothetical protein
MPDEQHKATALPKWVTHGPIALLVAGTVFYLAIAFGVDDDKKPFWGQAGDSIAPIAVLFNAFALLAVVYSIKLQLDSLGEQRSSLALQRKELRLQRKELALQREELTANREVMREHAEQAKETAAAQKRLADSQALLAASQDQANVLALHAEHAQRASTLAQLCIALSSDQTAEARKFEGFASRGGKVRGDRAPPMMKTIAAAKGLLLSEQQRLAEIEGLLKEDKGNEDSSE